MKRSHWTTFARKVCMRAARSDYDVVVISLLCLACEAHEKARKARRG